MAAHHVASLHTHVSGAPRGAPRMGALYDGIESMVAGSTAAGMAAAAAKGASLGVAPVHARAIAEAALEDFVDTRTEFLKPDVRAKFVALDLGH